MIYTKSQYLTKFPYEQKINTIQLCVNSSSFTFTNCSNSFFLVKTFLASCPSLMTVTQTGANSFEFSNVLKSSPFILAFKILVEDEAFWARFENIGKWFTKVGCGKNGPIFDASNSLLNWLPFSMSSWCFLPLRSSMFDDDCNKTFGTSSVACNLKTQNTKCLPHLIPKFPWCETQVG